jgi:hypothetical protein
MAVPNIVRNALSKSVIRNSRILAVTANCNKNGKQKVSGDGERAVIDVKGARNFHHSILRASGQGDPPTTAWRSTQISLPPVRTCSYLGSIRSMASKTPDEALPATKEIPEKALQNPAGSLYGGGKSEIDSTDGATLIIPEPSDFFIPQVELHDDDGRSRKRVLVLCTGGTLTMTPNPDKGGALSPVEGTVTAYMKEMPELCNEQMPEVVVHEYTPLLDSSDLGPNDWAVLANDIKANYWHFDGFVVLTGTDTMAYASTALSFMLEVISSYPY